MIAADPARLDDEASIEAADPGQMLRLVASSAAQLREARLRTDDAQLAPLMSDGRPRAVVVAGTGGSGLAGEVLAAVCGTGCPVPVISVHDHALPGWVGAADLVIAVSCSGTTEEVLHVAREAVRRGCRLLVVAAENSPLADIALQARAPFAPVRWAGPPRSALWALTVPLLLTARGLGLADVSDDVLETTAARLETMAARCRPGGDPYGNPAKQLALELAGTVPLVWGSSPQTAIAAHRLCRQLAENAGCPGVPGRLPVAGHDQIALLDGPYAGRRAGGSDDFFRDRADDAETRLHLVVLQDVDEHPRVRDRRTAAVLMARDRGVPVTEVKAEGEHPLERIAGLIALADYVTVYLAIALGVDPTPVPAIDELKARIRQ